MKKYFIDIVTVENADIKYFPRLSNSSGCFSQMADMVRDIFASHGYKLTNLVRKSMHDGDYIYYAIKFSKEV